MTGPATGRRHFGFPLAMQIMTLLLGGLVVAQLTTLCLTLLLPPAPVAQYRMEEIAAALRGARLEGHNTRPLVRVVRAQPPSLKSAGWLVSESSRHDLARLLNADEADVRLLFYSPLPFAGASAAQAIASTVPRQGRSVRLVAASFAPMELIRVDMQGPPGGVGGPLPGAIPAGRFPGRLPGGLPAGPPPGAATAGRLPPSVPAPPAGAATRPGGAAQTPRASEPPSPAGPAAPVTGEAARAAAAAERSGGAFPQGQVLRPAAGSVAQTPPNIAPPRPIGAGPTILTTPVLQRRVPEPAAPPLPVEQRSPDVRDRSAEPPAPARTEEPIVAAPSPPPMLAEAPATAAMVAAAPAIRTPPPQVQADDGPIADPTRQGRGLFGLAPAPFVQGDFVAAMRVATGQWVTVQPRPEPFPNSWQRRVLLWFLVSFSVVGPIGYLFARRLASPLARFADAAERLGRDPSGPVINLTGPAEIGRAAQAFNLMQGRLKRFIDDRTAMVGAISHDLRTPLARLRFRMERAPADLRPGVLHDVSQMEDMISSVLVFIRDASEPSVRERADLRSILECVVDDVAITGGDAVLEPGPPISVDVDTLGVQRVLANLIDNALKYGDRARVRMYADGGEAVAEVTDAGPGLSPEELERVFLPFYRSDSARGLNKTGIGLGLAVSRSIARAHGGDVTLSSRGDGLTAQLRLPLAHRAASPARRDDLDDQSSLRESNAA